MSWNVPHLALEFQTNSSFWTFVHVSLENQLIRSLSVDAMFKFIQILDIA